MNASAGWARPQVVDCAALAPHDVPPAVRCVLRGARPSARWQPNMHPSRTCARERGWLGPSSSTGTFGESGLGRRGRARSARAAWARPGRHARQERPGPGRFWPARSAREARARTGGHVLQGRLGPGKRGPGPGGFGWRVRQERPGPVRGDTFERLGPVRADAFGSGAFGRLRPRRRPRRSWAVDGGGSRVPAQRHLGPGGRTRLARALCRARSAKPAQVVVDGCVRLGRLELADERAGPANSPNMLRLPNLNGKGGRPRHVRPGRCNGARAARSARAAGTGMLSNGAEAARAGLSGEGGRTGRGMDGGSGKGGRTGRGMDGGSGKGSRGRHVPRGRCLVEPGRDGTSKSGERTMREQPMSDHGGRRKQDGAYAGPERLGRECTREVWPGRSPGTRVVARTFEGNLAGRPHRRHVPTGHSSHNPHAVTLVPGDLPGSQAL